MRKRKLYAHLFSDILYNVKLSQMSRCKDFLILAKFLSDCLKIIVTSYITWYWSLICWPKLVMSQDLVNHILQCRRPHLSWICLGEAVYSSFYLQSIKQFEIHMTINHYITFPLLGAYHQIPTILTRFTSNRLLSVPKVFFSDSWQYIYASKRENKGTEDHLRVYVFQ